MNKWKLTLGLFAVIALSTATGTASALKVSHILLNDKETDLGASQIIEEKTTLVPLKSLAADMGYTLSWDQNSKIAKLVRPEREVVFTINSKTAKVNGTALALSKTPRMLKGSLYVPLVSAVSALGGKTGFDNKDGKIYIVDEPRFTVTSVQGRSYWVSQKRGDFYYLKSASDKPVRIGNLPLNGSVYNHYFEVKQLGNGTDFLQLIDNHYAMFNNFSNVYQVLVQNGVILKQMDYQLVTAVYTPTQSLPATQLFMTDGSSLQYINQDGSLGKLFELEKITGKAGTFLVEYAAEDLALVRSKNTTQLYAIGIATGTVTNLSEQLISSEDRKEWDRADGSDPYVLSKMIVLKKREGNVLTFNYTPMIGGSAKKVTYTFKSVD
jgi:hypothetical protein